MSNISISLTYDNTIALFVPRGENVNISLAYDNNIALFVSRRENINLSIVPISSVNLAFSISILDRVGLDPMILLDTDKYRVKEIDGIVFDY